MKLIIVTGLSGAGKSHALRCLEDLGYYCVDNMPPALMDEFIQLSRSAGEIEKAAFGVDSRGGQFLSDFMESLEALRKDNIDVSVMFFEASDAALIRRYKETRRKHPLSGRGTIADGIAKERELMSEIRQNSDYVIDTSNLKTAGLNSKIHSLLSPGEQTENFTITVESFGYKKGIPAEADWVLDARFIPNPFYVASLKKLTGNNKKVRDYVMKSKEAQSFVSRICGLALDLIPSYVREGKYNLTICIGCTGGRHRSVATANALADHFEELGKHVTLIHRDL